MRDDPLPSSIDIERLEEKPWTKVKRRLWEEPLPPLGIAATCYAFYRAYKSMKARDSIQLNKMFRARIYAQGFTIVAIIGGSLYYAEERRQRRELERQLNEKKSKERRDAWLRELEIRDQEDREWRERHASIGKAVKDAEAKGLAQPIQRKTDENKGGQHEEDKKSHMQEGVAGSPVEGDASHGEKKGAVVDAVKALRGGGK